MDGSQIDAYLGQIHMKDPLTGDHCNKAAGYALRLGRELDLSPEELDVLEQAAILHDLGKLKVPDDILLKPSSLTEEEYEVIKCHPVWGADMIATSPGAGPERVDVAQVVRYHHERFDGRGYPEGLTATEIPFLAQIVAVADAFDAMTSDRPYRPALPLQRAREVLLQERGKQFNPDLVDRFVALIA